MPLTIDDVPDSFYGSYARKHKGATEADIIKAYEEQEDATDYYGLIEAFVE
ncbi:5762_t:CDS:2 [Paraglomus occultum]|uniref:5762_t:CDS:1 n=1 Tax=Paraglomus occultum TaxID=144539 RepID=A0A9N9CBP2_9GLOM|nr:5762_t:CDS:2 [Paraglomus occultum]